MGAGIRQLRGPDIGEAELSLAHFIVGVNKYWKRRFGVTCNVSRHGRVDDHAAGHGHRENLGSWSRGGAVDRPENLRVVLQMFCWLAWRSPKSAISRTAMNRRGLRLNSSLEGQMTTSTGLCFFTRHIR